ncbi:hypothetical protein Scep_004726 [Stephania cephalantha]|uniref:Uncharacterized protein n=1 Tax=Stephania cephalantha TaxID=152367 RepID=A0AAP0PVN4_9MAGN
MEILCSYEGQGLCLDGVAGEDQYNHVLQRRLPHFNTVTLKVLFLFLPFGIY